MRNGFLNNRNVRSLMLEDCERRICPSAVSFLQHEVVGDGKIFGLLTTADVDGDRDLDVLLVSPEYDEVRDSIVDQILWYENTDGKGDFEAKHSISRPEQRSYASLLSVDVDGDGDVDVLSTYWRFDEKVGGILWYENTDGKGTFETEHFIATVDGFFSTLFSEDIDGDGDVDVLWASSRGITWYENTDGLGSFGQQRMITSEATAVHRPIATDVDGDGDVDVLAIVQNRIAWYENIDGDGSFGPEQVLVTGEREFTAFRAVDVDGDSDVDVLAASGGDLSWYENTDGKGTFETERLIASVNRDIGRLFSEDMDGDGDMDILWAGRDEDYEIAWHENSDGQGRFGPSTLVFVTERFQILAVDDGVNHESVLSGDLDGDGDADILSLVGVFTSGNSPGYRVLWHENVDGRGSFGQPQTITPKVYNVQSVFPADVDGDGDMDVFSASTGDHKIAWYENTDGHGNYGPQQVIATDSEFGAASVFATDVDGDGDVDALSSSKYDDKIAWYANTDGRGSFGPQQVITTGDGARGRLFAADVDGDGDVDVLSASRSLILWFENTDGKGTFSDSHVIFATESQSNSVLPTDVADVDGDGDVDVLVVSGDGLAWHENTNGAGNFGEPQLVNSGANAVYTSDLDGDGDLDVLAGSRNLRDIIWHENIDGEGTFGEAEPIGTVLELTHLHDVHASDLDGDGDHDVLAVQYDRKILWFENTDGEGTFGDRQFITDVSGSVISLRAVDRVFTVDVDRDGRVDVLFALDNKVVWYENRIVGDTNNDGIFNSSDLVRVFQSGKYEDAIRGNATYEEGDWNGDGDFDSSDLVFAFQAGTYVATLRPTDIAAAIDSVLGKEHWKQHKAFVA